MSSDALTRWRAKANVDAGALSYNSGTIIQLQLATNIYILALFSPFRVTIQLQTQLIALHHVHCSSPYQQAYSTS